jgi:hypothetical protein
MSFVVVQDERGLAVILPSASGGTELVYLTGKFDKCFSLSPSETDQGIDDLVSGNGTAGAPPVTRGQS